MVLDLRTIPCAMINLPKDTARRSYMQDQFARLGMQCAVIPGVTKFGKKKNVAGAYSAAFDHFDKAPFIVFDDDQEMLWDDCVLPELPADADIVYLATRNSGCLPDTPENKATYGLHAYDGLALAEAYDDTYLRLYSMISSMAILIVSERGRARYRLELKKAFNRQTAADIRYAFAMPDLNVYALRQPMFAENIDLQTPSKTSDARVAMTHTPLQVGYEDEIRKTDHRVFQLTVQAKRDPETRSLNWQVVEAASTRTGKAVIPPTPIPDPASVFPLPGYNRDILKDRIAVIENAKVFPPDPETRSCGVTYADGTFCAFSREFKTPRRPSPPPEKTRTEQEMGRLEGTYLYAGWMHPHFGHFLLESTPRLWALDTFKDKIDGVIYIPLGPNSIWRTRKAYAPILNLLTGNVPTIPQTHPAKVERLIVPEPGFGHQSRMHGTQNYIDFMRERVARQVKADGPERLYVSRSQLNDTRGGVFGETLIEEFMVRNGYEVFHPQQHSALEQLARYKAARYLVSLDGSALHFASYAMEPGAKVGIIKRRKSDIPDYMVGHIKRFAKADVHLFETIKDMWVKEGTRHVDHRSFGELDLPALSRALGETGFLQSSDLLRQITMEEIDAYLASRHEGANRLAPLRGR